MRMLTWGLTQPVNASGRALRQMQERHADPRFLHRGVLAANPLWSEPIFSANQRRKAVAVPAAHTRPPERCSSSVVEHSLGKGEVESSILSCSTIPNSSIYRRLGVEPPEGGFSRIGFTEPNHHDFPRNEGDGRPFVGFDPGGGLGSEPGRPQHVASEQILLHLLDAPHVRA